MPEQNKLSTEANNTGCQDYELLAEYHSDIGQGMHRPAGTRGYKVVKGNGKQILLNRKSYTWFCFYSPRGAEELILFT